MSPCSPTPLLNPAESFLCHHFLIFLRTLLLLILTRGALAAAFPLFGIQMYERLGFDWATALLAFVTLVMLPFPYLFFRYGKRIRAKSRFATSS